MAARASARKTLRQSEKHRLRNKSAKSRIGTETRKFRRVTERGDAAGARTQLDVLTKLLQKAAAKGILHTRTAARKQSKLQNDLNKLASPGA